MSKIDTAIIFDSHMAKIFNPVWNSDGKSLDHDFPNKMQDLFWDRSPFQRNTISTSVRTAVKNQGVTMRPIKVAFISTNALTPGGVRQIVSHSDQPIEIVGIFADFQSVTAYASQNIVDVILIDEALPPHTNLLREVKTLNQACAGIAIVVILQRATASLAQRLLANGVRGILYKNDDLTQHLVQAIILGKQQGVHVSPSMSHFVNMEKELPVSLSERDHDVLKLLAEGLDPKGIALALGLGGNTVYRTLRNLRDMLNAQNNAHLVIIYYELTLVYSQ